jgi:hypothetical protein
LSIVFKIVELVVKVGIVAKLIGIVSADDFAEFITGYRRKSAQAGKRIESIGISLTLWKASNCCKTHSELISWDDP